MKVKATRYEIPIMVHGKGPFPIDMLRYDSCVPASESDANRIRSSLDGDEITTYSVNLIMFPREVRTPSISRWNSFGWEVVA